MSVQRARGRAVQLTLAACLGAVLVSCGSTGRPEASPSTTEQVTSALSSTTAPDKPAAPTSAPPPTTTSTAAAPGIEVGPGPQSVYSVQTQPPAGSCHYRVSGPFTLPDPRCTPGAVNASVTQSDISSTICASGYTSSIRPPENVTAPEKVGSAAAYGYTGPFHIAEYDHLVPLELGGDPNDPANLWVEPNDRPDATDTYNSKDVLESRLNDLVCSGRMTLVAAQQAIATDWVAAYRSYG
jgi:hypothetical protein